MPYSIHNGFVPASVLAGEPSELAQALAAYRPVDAAEALNSLGRYCGGRSRSGAIRAMRSQRR